MFICLTGIYLLYPVPNVQSINIVTVVLFPLVREKRFMHVPVIVQLPGYEPRSQDNCMPAGTKPERYGFARVFLQ